MTHLQIENRKTSSNEHSSRRFTPTIEQTRRVIITVLIAILFSLLAFQASIIASASNGDTVRVYAMGMANDVATLSPFKAIEDNEYIIMDFVYDYLFFPTIYNDTWPSLVKNGWAMDGIIASSLGTDFTGFTLNSEPSDWPYGSIWEYNLTEGVFWNDGKRFTAEDVEFTINIQIGPNYMIYWAFQPTTRWIDYVEVVNDYKLRIFFCEYDTKTPFPIAFGAELMIPIVPKHMFENKVSTYLAYQWDGLPMIGTGPFMGTESLRDELLAGETCTLIPNPYYNFIDKDGTRKGLGAAYNASVEIDKVLFKFYADKSTRQLALKGGKVDLAQISSDTYVTWMEDPDLPEYIRLASYLFSWQFSREVVWNAYADAPGDINPLRLDPAVQRASVLATNKSLLIDTIYKGLGVEGIGLISPFAEAWWWEPGNETSYFNLTDGNGNIIPEGSYQKPMKDVMDYDISLANRILDEAGYEWTGTPYESVRKAGPLVGARMENLFGVPPGEIADSTLDFDVIVSAGPFVDQEIFSFLAQQWADIGIYLTEELVNAAVWGQRVYSYTFELVITYWSGNYDPNYLCFIPTSFALYGWNEFGTTDPEYDNLYLNQTMVADYPERKSRSDKCIEWQYLSGSINTLAYPENHYAFSEKKWTNWDEEDLIYSFLSVEYNTNNDFSTTSVALIAGMAMILAVAAIGIVLFIRSKKRREEDLLFLDEDEYPKDKL